MTDNEFAAVQTRLFAIARATVGLNLRGYLARIDATHREAADLTGDLRQQYDAVRDALVLSESLGRAVADVQELVPLIQQLAERTTAKAPRPRIILPCVPRRYG